MNFKKLWSAVILLFFLSACIIPFEKIIGEEQAEPADSGIKSVIEKVFSPKDSEEKDNTVVFADPFYAADLALFSGDVEKALDEERKEASLVSEWRYPDGNIFCVTAGNAQRLSKGGWFIGFAPMMAIFIARISEGRSIRELILTVAIGAPVVTNFWFTVLGGTGIFFELQSPGSISGPLNAAGLPAVLLATLSQLPFSSLLVPAFLVLTTTFVVTTGDSMAYSISMVVSGNNEPKKSQRLFWAIAMGCVAAVLLVAGDGGLNALQSFIVVTAVPVSLLVAATLITGPLAVMRMQVHEKKKVQMWQQQEVAGSAI